MHRAFLLNLSIYLHYHYAPRSWGPSKHILAKYVHGKGKTFRIPCPRDGSRFICSDNANRVWFQVARRGRVHRRNLISPELTVKPDPIIPFNYNNSPVKFSPRIYLISSVKLPLPRTLQNGNFHYVCGPKVYLADMGTN